MQSVLVFHLIIKPETAVHFLEMSSLAASRTSRMFLHVQKYFWNNLK
jgi:hypothetical protein